MTKEDLLVILIKLRRTERSPDFLLRLDENDDRTLIICIRDRLDKESHVFSQKITDFFFPLLPLAQVYP